MEHTDKNNLADGKADATDKGSGAASGSSSEPKNVSADVTEVPPKSEPSVTSPATAPAPAPAAPPAPAADVAAAPAPVPDAAAAPAPAAPPAPPVPNAPPAPPAPPALPQAGAAQAAAAEGRASMLKRRLVTDYRRNHRRGNQAGASDEESTEDKIFKWGDRAATAAGLVFDAESYWKRGAELNNNIAEADPLADQVFGGLSAALPLWSFVSSARKANENRKAIGKNKVRTKKRKKAQAWASMIGNISGSATGLLSATSKAVKYWGLSLDAEKTNPDLKLTDQEKDVLKDRGEAAKIIGFLGSIGSFVGNTSKMISGIAGRSEHKRIRDLTAQNYGFQQNQPLAAHTGNKPGHDFKARNYAMRMAHDFNGIKGNQIVKGGFGFAQSALGLISSGVKSFANVQSPLGKLALLGTDLIGSVLKYGGRCAEENSDTDAKKEIKTKKLDYINHYIGYKKDRIETAAAFRNDPFVNVLLENQPLKDNEKQRIIVGRLGLDVDIVDQPLSDEEKTAAFKFLALRRARNIYNSPNKATMLGELGLANNASIEEIAKVITGG